MRPRPGKYKVVLFDFDGVLCHDRFYTRLIARHPKTREYVETRIFGDASDLSRRWMRGELSSSDVNRLISEDTGVDIDEVTRLFVEGVSQMRVDTRLIALARRLSDRGVRVGLVTGNMDVFNEITIERLSLREAFPVIVNSCNFGCLKDEENGRLFDIAMSLLGRTGDFANALLVDDSAKARAAFRLKGGDAFPYSSHAIFARWADRHLA